MADRFAFPWPPLPGGSAAPVWDGAAFLVGGERRLVLDYSGDQSAWDARLTSFHEETASCDHPIDVASRDAAVRALGASLSPDAAAILEVGSSSGFLLPLLRHEFPNALVIGSDAFPEALVALARHSPGFPLLQFDLTRCPLPDACVEAVVALNVLEHIKDDRLAIVELSRILKPGGIVYLEVPAGAWLYDIYDELLHHHRRYAAARMRQLAQSVGLHVERLSHLGCLVFPFFAATKLWNRRLRGASAEAKRTRVAGNISSSRRSAPLAWAFAAEARLGRFVRLPFGIRCACLLRKPV